MKEYECENCLNTEYIQDKLHESYKNGYNKAIDDFKHQMEAEIESSAKFIREYDDSLPQKAYHSGLSHALKIAEQVKKERN